MHIQMLTDACVNPPRMPTLIEIPEMEDVILHGRNSDHIESFFSKLCYLFAKNKRQSLGSNPCTLSHTLDNTSDYVVPN